MMKIKILSFAAKDIKNALRNNIVVYGILFPIILALGFKLLLPSVQQFKITVAVHEEVGEAYIQKLKQYCSIELFKSKEDVYQRVKLPDDVAGFVLDKNNKLSAVLEGNEAGEAEEIALILLRTIDSDFNHQNYSHIAINKDNSQTKNYAGAMLLLSCLLIASLIISMNIVDEKESKAIKALSVTPINMMDFIASHMLLSLFCSLLLGAVSSIIFSGFSINYINLLISTTASLGVSLSAGFLIGSLADNMISAIAILKVIMLFFAGIPIGSLFTPEKMQWLFYIFPNYWAFNSFKYVFSDNQIQSFNSSLLMTFLTGIVAVLIMVPFLKRNLKLK